MPQQTSIDWLLENIPTRFRNAFLNSCKDEIEKAKDLHKQEIMQAVYDSMGTNFDPNYGRAELYYKEKYETV